MSVDRRRKRNPEGRISRVGRARTASKQAGPCLIRLAEVQRGSVYVCTERGIFNNPRKGRAGGVTGVHRQEGEGGWWGGVTFSLSPHCSPLPWLTLTSEAAGLITKPRNERGWGEEEEEEEERRVRRGGWLA